MNLKINFKSYALVYGYDTYYLRHEILLFVIKIRLRRINMKKIFWWLLMPSCLIIFTLMWQSLKKSDKKDLKIGIIQYVEHEALDASRKGFIDGLNELGFSGKIDYKNAQADQANCTLIANQFVSEEADLILAIATPAAQSLAAITSSIPILGTAITDFQEAGLTQSNITGTSDLAPISKQIHLVKELKPNAKKIGILFSSSEANSKYQAQIAFEEAQKIGLSPQIFTFSQMTEIQQVVESMFGKVDAIYTPTDNMVASNMQVISKTAMQGNIPVICSEVNLISKGAVGTFAMDYYELGKQTANQAFEILEGKNYPENMPIQYLENVKLALNTEVTKKLNLKETSP